YYIALAELVAQGYLRSGGNLWVELNPLYATATEEAMLERIGRRHAKTKLIHDLSGKVRFLHLTYCPAE
ncbi:MAG: peptide chain release factor N(5)-glutamine methyltransferase, partial [Porphyromonadaceae bacterium]|nr:peptide chain release factor N(5)-glutamine methyltransferase [Porphyromonadaceae bacterium]